jgi:hypothetical protein
MTGIKLPYIVTIEEGSREILSIRRNYEIADPKKNKINYFVHFKFLPGLGFYGFGLIHMIGGLSRTATSALRQLIDISNLTLSGFTLSNYYIQPISPITGLILKKSINTYFNYTEKVYDNTPIVYGLVGTLSGFIVNDTVNYLTSKASFRNILPGLQVIDISYIYLFGDQSNNYIAYPINPIYGLIFQINIEIVFYGGIKIYNSNTIPGPITYIINNDLSNNYNLNKNYLDETSTIF